MRCETIGKKEKAKPGGTGLPRVFGRGVSPVFSGAGHWLPGVIQGADAEPEGEQREDEEGNALPE